MPEHCSTCSHGVSRLFTHLAPFGVKSSLGRLGFFPIMAVYRKLGTGQGNFIRQLMYRIAYHSAPAVRIHWAMQACIMQPLPQIGARFRRRRASSRMTSRMR